MSYTLLCSFINLYWTHINLTLFWLHIHSKFVLHTIDWCKSMNFQYWISKLRHLISVWIREHFSWQILYPHRGQLDRARFPQIEQYFRDGYFGRPTTILTKLGSVFIYRPSSWIIFLRFRFLLRWFYFLARLFTLF